MSSRSTPGTENIGLKHPAHLPVRPALGIKNNGVEHPGV